MTCSNRCVWLDASLLKPPLVIGETQLLHSHSQLPRHPPPFVKQAHTPPHRTRCNATVQDPARAAPTHPLSTARSLVGGSASQGNCGPCSTKGSLCVNASMGPASGPQLVHTPVSNMPGVCCDLPHQTTGRLCNRPDCSPDADWLAHLDRTPELSNLLLVSALSLEETTTNSTSNTWKSSQVRHCSLFGQACADATRTPSPPPVVQAALG